MKGNATADTEYGAMAEKAWEKDLAYFQSQKEYLSKHYACKMALIHGQKLIGTFPDLSDAFKEGLQRFGGKPFSLMHIPENNANETPIEEDHERKAGVGKR